MKCVAVSSSTLFSLGNWSPRFVIPYVEFVEALRNHDRETSDARFEEIAETLSRHHRETLETLVNGVLDLPALDAAKLAAEVRAIIFHHTRDNLWREKEFVWREREEDLFQDFVVEWLCARWNNRANKALAEAEEAAMNADRIRRKFQKQNKDERTADTKD